ncbi:MAG TPA: phosphatase PAP2 family protein [Vicinamibacterales bacterium]|nr:phosphatase PAP2 family protein [Vicinamibacterales bacterium]
MIELRWEWIALGYFAYLLIVAMIIPRFARARVGALAGLAVSGLALVVQSTPLSWLGEDSPAFAFVVPLAVLLGGYWLSGLFFVSPMQAIERQLMAADDRLLRGTGVLAAYRASPQVVHEFFEMAYVLVYLVIPAGVVTLAMGGHAGAIPRFWAIVLLAEFVSYGTMPWLQTRPPRALESTVWSIQSRSDIRRFNAAILDRGSIGANTVPSGHAAGAVATALAVVDVMPSAGAVFLLLAACIVAATVLGRYHYLVDSLLGVVVAVAAWYLCR